MQFHTKEPTQQASQNCIAVVRVLGIFYFKETFFSNHYMRYKDNHYPVKANKTAQHNTGRGK